MTKKIANFKRKILVIKLLIPVVLFFLFIIFMVSLFPQMDEVDIASTIDVPYDIVRMVEEKYDDEFVYYLAIAGDDLSYDWQGFRDLNYLDELGVYNMRFLSDLYAYDKDYRMIVDLYQQTYGDIECFTIPRLTYERVSRDTSEIRLKTPKYTIYDDFGEKRDYKKVTRHKGNDTIADEMTPLLSMTDGILERVGWNEHGGWRVGIRAPSGAYFYYAHMEAYGWEIEDGHLKQGDRIKAGQLIGYVGDTGYGPVGTEGKFVNHLHLQIGVKLEDFEGDFWVNPYNAMRFKEKEKRVLDIYDDEDEPVVITHKEYKQMYGED